MPRTAKNAKLIPAVDAGIEKLEKFRLGPREVKLLRKLLEIPPEPNARLIEAAKTYMSRQ